MARTCPATAKTYDQITIQGIAAAGVMSGSAAWVAGLHHRSKQVNGEVRRFAAGAGRH